MVHLLSTVQLQGTFRRALIQLVQIGFFQSALFVAFSLVPPVQTALPQDGTACSPHRSDFAKLSELCLAMMVTLLGSMASAMVPIQAVGDNQRINANGRSAWTVRFLRGTAIVAVSLSLITMGLGLAVTFTLLVVKTTRVSCWSTAKTALAIVLLAGASSIFVVYYLATFRVVLSDEMEEPAPARRD